MNSWTLKSLICTGISMLSLAANAAPVADVLIRPALAVTNAAQSVLLGASLAGTRLVAVGERGIVVLSDDEGRSWRQAQVPVSITLTAVQMVDAHIGYAVGHGGVILATGDGGETWRKLTDGVQLAQAALNSARASGNAQAIKAAELLVADGADKPLLDLHFVDARHGLVVGAANLAFVTADAGKTWQSIAERLDNPRALHLYTIRSRGDTMLIAGEQGLVYLSGDAGLSFKRVVTPYNGSFFTAELPADNEIVLAGLRGNVWRSTDGGSSWARIEVSAPASFISSVQSAAQRPVLANQAGQLFVLDGARLSALPITMPSPLNAVQPLADGRWLALSGIGAVVTDKAVKGAAK